MLGLVLQALVQGKSLTSVWYQCLVLLGTVLYHLVVALFNPTDQYGDDYGSINMFRSSIKSAVIRLEAPLTLGPLTLSSLSTRFTIKLNWRLRAQFLEFSLSVDHFLCDVELNEYYGLQRRSSTSPMGKVDSSSSIADLCNTYLKSMRHFGILVEVKSVNININNSIRVCTSALSTQLTVSKTDSGVSSTSKLVDFSVWCVAVAPHSPTGSTPSSEVQSPPIESNTRVLNLPLLSVSSVEVVLDASPGQQADNLSVVSQDAFVCVSTEHTETVCSTIVQVVNNITPHTDTYHNDRFEALMQRFAAIERHKQRYLHKMRQARDIFGSAVLSVSDLHELWDEEDDTHELYVDSPEKPVSQGNARQFHGADGHKAPLNCTVSLARTGVILCTRDVTAPVQVLFLSDSVLKLKQQAESTAKVLATPSDPALGDSAPWTHVETAVRNVQVSIRAMETAVVSLAQCTDGTFAARLKSTSTTPPNSTTAAIIADALEPDQIPTEGGSSWLSVQYTVTATLTSASTLFVNEAPAARWRYAADLEGEVAPFDLSLQLPAVGTLLHCAAQVAADVACLAKLAHGHHVDVSLQQVHAPASQEQGIILPWRKLVLSVPAGVVRLLFPPSVSVVETETAGVAVVVSGLKFFNSLSPVSTAAAAVVLYFITADVLKVARVSDAVGGELKEFVSVDTVHLSLILTAPRVTHFPPSAPALQSSVAYEKWAASELLAAQNQEVAFESDTTLQVGAVNVLLDRRDLLAVGVAGGLLDTSARVYNPLQHFLLSPVSVSRTRDCAPHKLYVVVVSTTVALRWDLEGQAIESELQTITGDVVTYHLLSDCQISYSVKRLGRVYAHSQLFLHDDILVRRVSTLRGREVHSVELLRITDSTSSGVEATAPDHLYPLDEEDESGERASFCAYPQTNFKLTGFSGRRHCLFSSKRLPNEQFTCEFNGREGDKWAVGVVGEFTNTILPDVFVSMDYLYVDALCRLLGAKSDGVKLGENFAIQHVILPVQPVESEYGVQRALQNADLMTLPTPTAISAVHVKKFKINMLYELQPVLSFNAKGIDVHQLAFGPALSQMAVVAHSLYLFELTANYAVHTCILGDIDANMPNRVELHLTNKQGECPLLEMQIEQIRLFYIQRSVMVLLSFLRDHFAYSLYTTPSSTFSSVALDDAPTVHWAPPLHNSRGLTRMGIVFHKSEAHLPLSSCSTDALVVLIDNTHVYRTFPEMTPALTSYCKGPLILRKQWVGELRNSRKLIYLLFAERVEPAATSASVVDFQVPGVAVSSSSGTFSALSQLFQPLASPTASSENAAMSFSTANTPSTTAAGSGPQLTQSSLKWNLPGQSLDIMVPGVEILAQDFEELCLAFSVINSMICTWCDANAVTEDVSLNGVYVLKAIPPSAEGKPRSHILVDVTADQMEWTLAQGQYLALINLIQHNFCELQELVPDKFALGPPQSVRLGEKTYGKYALDESLPICDTVPIHVKRGKIIAVESLPEYFDLFCVPLPPAHFPYGVGGHAIPPSTAEPVRETAFKDTLPAYSKHVHHRNKFFAKMASQTHQPGQKGAYLPKNKFKSRASVVEEHEPETGESIIGVLFERLELDFYRRHETGGNGIEVSAGTFVIVGIEDHNDDDDDVNSKHSVNIDELSLDSIIFAPRSFPLLNSGGNRSVFQASKAKSPRPDGAKDKDNNTEPRRSAEDKPDGLKFHNTESSLPAADAEGDQEVTAPHITYSQQGTGNLRRCIVTISDSMAVANIAKVLHTVEYFLKPIHVGTHRSLFAIAQSHEGPYDYKIALDMEVHVSNTVVCLTNISRRDGANALCFQVNLDYEQAWRGFLSSGPGLFGLNIDISVMNIYIAPMREINSNRIQSLVDPCILVIGQEMRINPPTESLATNLALLTPHMRLGKWVNKVNNKDTPMITRILRFTVAPANRPASTPSTGATSKASKRRNKNRNKINRSKSDVDVDLSDQVPDELLRSLPEDSSSEEGDSDDSETSDSDAEKGGEDDDDGPMLGDAYYSGAETMNAPTVRIQISLKDITFIAVAVNQARTALNKRLVITTNQEDFFAKSKLTVQDINHIPRLTYYLVHTALQVPGRKNKHNELLAEICDFEAILRNNTYNLNILRLNIFDNCTLYTRSPEVLHMASGSAAAVWAYNEATDLWEPLVEPFNMRAIGATDESIQAAGMTPVQDAEVGPDGEKKKRKGAKVRIEVVTDPLEFNAPQTALGHLIRKLSLADVVTTSSIHLPPYKVINELGVDVKFAIGMGDGIITEKDIGPGSSLPVEVHQLAEALDAFKLRRNYTAGGNSVNESTANKEYVMGITFPNFRDIYQSRVPLAIDKVGVHTYDMYHTGQKVADPLGEEITFDKRRISMGGMGSGMGNNLKAAIAAAAAAAATARNQSSEGAETGDIMDAGERYLSEGSVHSTGVPPAPPSQDASPDTPLFVPKNTQLSPVAEEVSPLAKAASEDSLAIETDVTNDGVSPRPLPPTPNSPAKGLSSFSASPRTPQPVKPDAPSPARPNLARRLSLAGPSSSSDPVKFSQEVPLVIMEMKIKADGVREILLRSILSFKNNTTRVFQMSVRLYGSSVETTLAPGKEWYVPVRFVNPKASLFIRLDEKANWFEALSSIQGLIVQGKWGDPTRLRAQLCACPPESPEVTVGGHGWMLLIKPEVKDLKAQMQGGANAKLFIPVRYPNKEAYTKAMKEVTDVNFSMPASSSGIAGGPMLKMGRTERAQPMCVQLLAPLQLCNLVPQPFLYRLADAEGLITSEGILLPGEMVDIHSVFKLFTSRIFISVRMLNYCWSKWTLVFSRTNPFSATERSTELTLNSMNFIYQNKEHSLPSVDVFMTMKEYLIRFSCPVLISNRTGLQLDLCESSTTESFIPHGSRTAAEAFLPVLAYHRHKKGQHKHSTSQPATPNMRDRPSFRHTRAPLASASGNNLNGSARRSHRVREIPDDDLRLGDFDLADDEGNSSDCDTDECEELCDSDAEPVELRQSSESFTLGNPLYLGSDDGHDSGDEGSLKGALRASASDGDVPGMLSSPQLRRPQLSADNLSHSPFSPTTSTPPDGPTTFSTPGFDVSSSSPVPAKGGRVIVVTVHFPFDHLRQVDVACSADWTLRDVFLRVKQRLAAASSHQTSTNYVFFPWDNGKLGPRKVDNSLIIEAQQQYESAGDPQSLSTKIRPENSSASLAAPIVAPAQPAASVKESRPISMMFSRDRSVTNISATSRKAPVDTEVPEPMQFEMLAECSATPLPLTTKVDLLKGLRLRLCHVAEWEIYKQTKAIKTEVVEKEGLFSAMFSRPKCTHHTTLVPFEGDIPFKPHRMLGFSPSMSLRVPSSGTDWSDALDVIKGDFDSSELCITTCAAPPLPTGSASSSKLHASRSSTASLAVATGAAPPAVLYEFGAYLERGRGFLHNITTVTLVPKHVIVSRLSMAIQIKQILPSADVAPLTLMPGTLCSYHFPSRSRSKLLHIRRAPAGVVGADGSTHSQSDPSLFEEDWQAEVDICKLGVLYAKLRNPLQIIKVQIDTVGASMVATLTEQSTLWPPYRIDNMTEMEIRFRQITAAPVPLIPSLGALGRKNSIDSSKLPTEIEIDAMAASTHSATSASADEAVPAIPLQSAVARTEYGTANLARGHNLVPWDHLEKHNSAAYAWDLPFSGKKTVELEVRQLQSSWVRCEVSLDDDDKPASVIVKKTAPSLGNPFAEGFLLRQDATGDAWTRVYCILRPDVLYIYPDETRDYLIEVINFSQQSGAGDPQFAAVSRLADKKKPSTMGYLSAVLGSSSASKSKLQDINRARCLILKLAEDMGLFVNVTAQAFRRKGRGDSSDGESDGVEDVATITDAAAAVAQEYHHIDDRDSTLDILTQVASSNNLSGDGDENVEEKIIDAAEVMSKVSFRADLEIAAAAPEAAVDEAEEVTLQDEILELLERRQSIVDIPNMVAPVAVELTPHETEHSQELLEEILEEPESARSSGSESPLRKARFSSAPGSTLASLLAAGVSTEELLEEASNVSLRVEDIVLALMTTKQVDKVDKAREMVEWMLTEGLLMPRAASKAITGGTFFEVDDRDFVERDHPADFDLDDEDADELTDRFTMTVPPSRSVGLGLAGAGGNTSRESLTGLNEPTSRISFTRPQVQRSLTTRGSLTAEDLAEPGTNRRSITTLSRKKNTLYKLYENADLYFCPPALNPEMMAMLEQINQQDADEIPPSAASSGGTTAGSGPAEAEIFGFTIAMETKKYNFKCSSEMEFFGWIQACRQSIELLWVDHLLGRRADKKAVRLEDYQATILLRLRADGSTKVLEVIQDDVNVGKESKGKFLRRNKTPRRGSVSSAEAVGKLSRFIRNSHLTLGLGYEHKMKEFDREKELISVLFSVQSIALSVIDSEPSELLYFSFHGIEITVERSLDLVKFSVTVQEVQLSNQLLNPEFPVALFPRRIKEGISGRLMLPGLNPDRTSFPSLHVYFQQRYHQSINDVGSAGANDSFEEDSHLHYFEMFTVWLSPLQLDVDEEIIVKCIRYLRGLKDVVHHPNFGRSSELKEDILNLQLLGSKSWEGNVDRRAVFEVYLKLLDAGKEPYLTYNPTSKSKTGIYFSLLQLHPIDLVMSFRPSPNLVVTNSELAMISIISQLDSARLCLNALIAEHAFGSPAKFGEVLVKHYKAAFWRQFHRLIGSSDIVEGSVGLVANLGSGVYDLFYEPIDGLLDENGSFLNGLSKGGISLASRTIGGTSAFTSQITGGLGKGVSLLTLDSQFQRNRAYRRFNKTSTVSEGLYVGTQELGKNIMEGVTGIVVSPYRGWESGGGVGFGIGVAKGILGVALKPAVGMLDLASRATEGLRNTAFNSETDLGGRYGIFRKRIPRAFGRNGQIALYDAKAAAAQYVADSMTFFKPEPRLQVVHHLYIRRKLERFRIPGVAPTESPEELARDVLMREAWGMSVNRSYVVLVGHNRIALAELTTPKEPSTTGKKVSRKRAIKPRKFIWSCPASCIEQLFSDPRGDLILSIGNSALISGTWNNSSPVVVDNYAQNYVIFQSLLEQTIGPKRARTQPFAPTEGFIQNDIRKRYSTGIKSFFVSPTNHTYRLFGNVLYEYSDGASKKQAMKAEAGGNAGTASAEAEPDKTAPGAEAAEPATAKSEIFIDQVISRIFPTDVSPAALAAAAPSTKPLKAGDPSVDDMYLSFVYPLVDLYIAGPVQEDNGRHHCYSITLSRLDGQKMRVLKSEEDQDHISEYLKNSLSLIFNNSEDAHAWKRQLDEHMLWNLDVDELVPPGPLTVEERRKQGRTLMTMARGGEEVIAPEDNSILGLLVLPTSGCKAEQTETIKIEIAKTLSSTRWR